MSSNLFCGYIPVEILALPVGGEGFGLQDGNSFGTACVHHADDHKSSDGPDQQAVSAYYPSAHPAKTSSATFQPSDSLDFSRSPTPSLRPTPATLPSDMTSSQSTDIAVGDSFQNSNGAYNEGHQAASVGGISIAVVISMMALLVASRLTYLLFIDRPWNRIKPTPDRTSTLPLLSIDSNRRRHSKMKAPLLSYIPNHRTPSSTSNHPGGPTTSTTTTSALWRAHRNYWRYLSWGLRQCGCSTFIDQVEDRSSTSLAWRFLSCAIYCLFGPIGLVVAGVFNFLFACLKIVDRGLGLCVLVFFRCLMALDLWRPGRLSSDEFEEAGAGPETSGSESEEEKSTLSTSYTNSELSDDINYAAEPGGIVGVVIVASPKTDEANRGIRAPAYENREPSRRGSC